MDTAPRGAGRFTSAYGSVAFFQTTTAARSLPLGDCPDQVYR
jgi:hypothetical protein